MKTIPPLYKRVFICCVLNRKKWKLARAYSKVAVDLLFTEEHEMSEKIREKSDKLWAEIYS